MKETTAKEILRQNLYYFIIGLLSIGVLIIFPFLRSDADVGWGFPTTSAGWFLFWFEKISVTCINLSIFTAFKKQAVLNVKDNEMYQKARKLLNAVREKKSAPRSPAQYQAISYAKKGTTLILSTICSLIAIGNMILRFDYNTLIAYTVTLVMGIVFGVFAMKADEIYWTEDYYYYALQQAEELGDLIKQDEEEHNGNQRQSISES